MYWAALSAGEDGGLVAEVREIGAGEPGRLPRDRGEVDVRRQRLVARVDAEDRLAPCHVRGGDEHLPIEAAGAQESGVEVLEPVGRGHDDDLVARVEAVELDEELVQGLVVLTVEAAAEPGRPDRVELVDEDDRRRVLARLVEELADPRGTEAGEHLDEGRGALRVEVRAGRARDGLREERLPGAGRAVEQDSSRNPRPQALEALSVLEELDDLLELRLRLVEPGHVGPGHLDLRPTHDRRRLRPRHEPERVEEQDDDDPEEHDREPRQERVLEIHLVVPPGTTAVIRRRKPSRPRTQGGLIPIGMWPTEDDGMRSVCSRAKHGCGSRSTTCYRQREAPVAGGLGLLLELEAGIARRVRDVELVVRRLGGREVSLELEAGSRKSTRDRVRRVACDPREDLDRAADGAGRAHETREAPRPGRSLCGHDVRRQRRRDHRSDQLRPAARVLLRRRRCRRSRRCRSRCARHRGRRRDSGRAARAPPGETRRRRRPAPSCPGRASIAAAPVRQRRSRGSRRRRSAARTESEPAAAPGAPSGAARTPRRARSGRGVRVFAAAPRARDAACEPDATWSTPCSSRTAHPHEVGPCTSTPFCSAIPPSRTGSSTFRP